MCSQQENIEDLVLNSSNETKSKTITLDEIMRLCGDLGRFQLIHLFFINLISMSTGMISFYYVFGAAEPNHRCQLSPSVWPNDTNYWPINRTHEFYINKYIPKGKDGQFDPCKRYNSIDEQNPTLVDCPNGWVYDRSVFGYTFTEEANLVCRNASKRSWISTLMQSGGYFLIIIGSLGDKFGRKKITVVLSCFIWIMSLVTQIPMQWIPMTTNTKFALLLVNQLVSGLISSTYSIIFVLTLELTSSSHTSLVGNIALVTFTIGEAILALFAYLTFDWQKLKWVNTIFTGLFLPYLYFLPETPLYLHSKRNYKDLEKLLRKIATQNKRSEIDWYPTFQSFINNQSNTEIKNINQLTFSQQLYRTFSTKPIILKLCTINLLGFTTYFLYYQISYGLEILNISPYLGVFIGAVVEAFGYITSSVLIVTRLGRKRTFMIMTGLTAICILLVPFINQRSATGSVFVSQIGKFTISGGIAVSWIFVPELFQTSVRSSANGFFIAFCHIGAIVAPILNASVPEQNLKITFYGASLLAVIVLLLTMFLPETKDRSMDEENTL